MKIYTHTRLLCLLLCLVMTGCAEKNTVPPGNDDSPWKDATIITAPVDADPMNNPTDTRPPSAPGKDTTAAAPDTTQPIDTTMPVLPPDTTLPPFDTTAPTDTTAPADTTAPPPAETTAPEIVIPVLPSDISIGDKLAVDHPVSGTIVSTEGKKISLEVAYTANMAIDGSVTIDFDVGLRCYNINCGGRYELGHLKVNSTEHVFSTPALNRESSSATVIPFTKFTYRAPAGQDACRISADWQYYGYYGDQYIKLLTCNAVLRWDVPDDADAAQN